MKKFGKRMEYGQSAMAKRMQRSALPALLLIILIAFVGQFYSWRFDLTDDHRYTLSPFTHRVLAEAQQPIYITCYLGGTLPLEFARLRNGVQDLLEEYQYASHYRLEFRFQNPNEEVDPRKREAFRGKLIERGVRPLTVQVQSSQGSAEETLIFPALSIAYAGRSTTLNILSPNASLTSDEMIDLSLQTLEYGITATIEQLFTTRFPRIALLQGHGELSPEHCVGLAEALAQRFSVERCDFPRHVGDLDTFRIVVCANPTQTFTEQEKLILDQYIMHGGRFMLLQSPVNVAVDSLMVGENTIALPQATNLEDLLFRYGVRLNPVVLQDAQCALIPVNTALAGQPPRFTPRPWLYYPLLTPFAHSSITRGVNVVYSRFPSSIDLVGDGDSIGVVPLLSTSPMSRVLEAPRMVSLAEIASPPPPQQLHQGQQLVGVLLDGSFPSGFTNRPLAAIAPDDRFTFRSRSRATRIAVFADGTLARNEMALRQGQPRPLPLGFDRYTQQTFGNAELLANVALALDGQDELLSLRNRTIAARRLDQQAVVANRNVIILINVALPLLLLVAGGGCYAWSRKRKYTQRGEHKRSTQGGGASN